MSRKIKIINKGYYGGDEILYKKKIIEINPGVTVLVGCNGIGKTTLLRQIEDELKKKNIPCLKFDNLGEGGHHSVGYHASIEDFEFVATASCSSEGENIYMNIYDLAKRIGRFIATGDPSKGDKYDKLFTAISKLINKDEDTNKSKKELSDERWILLDAIDSGFSVDNIVEIKQDLFKTILDDNHNGNIYIVISANEYELCRGEQCFDVYNGKYVTFKDYEDYRDFILESREWKENRNYGKMA